jgi:transposase InsO family protein
MAIWRRGQMRAAGAVHHSDQGSQYTSFAFTRRLAAEGPRREHGHRRRRPRQRDALAQRGRLYGPRLTLLPWQAVFVRAAIVPSHVDWLSHVRVPTDP